MSGAKPTKPNQCKATRRDGKPCPVPALAAGYCFAHDPALAAKRVDARKVGGQNRAGHIRLGKLVPPRLLSVYDALEKALDEVHDGKLDPRQATAMAALARAMVACLTAGEWETRFREVERRLVETERGIGCHP